MVWKNPHPEDYITPHPRAQAAKPLRNGDDRGRRSTAGPGPPLYRPPPCSHQRPRCQGEKYETARPLPYPSTTAAGPFRGLPTLGIPPAVSGKTPLQGVLPVLQLAILFAPALPLPPGGQRGPAPWSGPHYRRQWHPRHPCYLGSSGPTYFVDGPGGVSCPSHPTCTHAGPQAPYARSGPCLCRHRTRLVQQ